MALASPDSLAKAALDHFGVPDQVDQSLETLSALVTALSQWKRGSPEARQDPDFLAKKVAEAFIAVRKLRFVAGSAVVDTEVQRLLKTTKDLIRLERSAQGDKPSSLGERPCLS